MNELTNTSVDSVRLSENNQLQKASSLLYESVWKELFPAANRLNDGKDQLTTRCKNQISHQQKDLSKAQSNDQLSHQHKGLSSIEHTNPGQQLRAAESKEKVLEKGAAELAVRKSEWTVVVDLAVRGLHSSPIANTEETKKLQNFLDKTLAEGKGEKPVTIIVQASSADGKKVERYVLQNGEVTHVVPDTDSKGIVADLKAALEFAARYCPSQKLGVVLHSHGMGNAGIVDMSGKDDAGTLDKLAECIKSGLENSGHKKLDVLDFDACLMGQDGVAEKLQNVVKHVVASQEEEGAITPQGSGQDLIVKSVLASLISGDMNDGKLADALVEQAGTQDKDQCAPVTTLAHYDLEACPRFQEAMDKLGAQLKEVLKDPMNRDVLHELIKSTKAVPEGDPDLRDLSDFTKRLITAIADHRLNAPETLMKTAEEVLAAEKLLVKKNYVHDPNDHLGGINVFLPEKKALDFAGRAAKYAPELRLFSLTNTDRTENPAMPNNCAQCEKLRRELGGDDGTKGWMGIIDDVARGNKDKLDPASAMAIKEVKIAWDNLRNIKLSSPEQPPPHEFIAALKSLHDKAAVLKETNFAKTHLSETQQEIQTMFQNQRNPNGGWRDFQDALIAGYNESDSKVTEQR